ncbi:hypothetical protein A6A07_31050 [Streptomyces sp. CB03911]|nr:hypothetical protein A6A07_31050 [Streptomyces sp. CB03911]
MRVSTTTGRAQPHPTRHEASPATAWSAARGAVPVRHPDRDGTPPAGPRPSGGPGPPADLPALPLRQFLRGARRS